MISLKQFSEDNGLDVLGILTAFTDNHDKFCREILLSVKKKDMGEKLSFLLENSPILGLNRENLPLKDKENIWYWKQTQITASRKQIQPLVHNLLMECSSKI